MLKIELPLHQYCSSKQFIHSTLIVASELDISQVPFDRIHIFYHINFRSVFGMCYLAWYPV